MEIGIRAGVLEAIETKQIARNGPSESHVRKVLDKNQRFEHQLDWLRVEKELHKAWDGERTKVVTEAMAELANAMKALHVLEGRASGGI